MSKQSSLFTFMSRNDKDTPKTASSNDVSAPVKSTGKFKFNPKSRLQQQQHQTNADENRTINTIVDKSNGFEAASIAQDCVVISDESDNISPVKIAKAKKTDDDDLFEDFNSNDLTFARASTLVKNQLNTMEDLYAKYGSPKPASKGSIDSFDIDKELNSNETYVNAVKKLGENLDKLKKSPQKITKTSKFKFNTRSKPATSVDQNTTHISNASNSGKTSFSSTITSATSDKTSTITSDSANKFTPSADSRNETTSMTSTNTVTAMNSSSIVSSFASNSYSSVSNSNKTEAAATDIPTENSFKTTDSSPKEKASPPSTSPGTKRDPFTQVDAFMKKVNGISSISSQVRNNLPELRKYSTQIEQWYAESLEKYCELFDGLPKSTLETIFGSKTEIFLKLKVLKQSLKAKTKVNQKAISKLELQEVHDLTQFDEPSMVTRFNETSSFDYNGRSSTFNAIKPSSFETNTRSNTFEHVKLSNFETTTKPSTSDVDFDMGDIDEFDMMVSRTGDLGTSTIDITPIANGIGRGESQMSTGATSQNSDNSMGNFYSGTKNDGLSGEFDGYNYAHSELMQTSLRYTFGLKSFRTNQLQAINATMLGLDCFVLMPTGGGKSLCYQLPATLTESVTIIISPLKSLILDQVNKLQALDITARNLSGEQSLQDVNVIYRDLEATPPLIKVLYVTPEKISASPRLQDLMQKLYNKGAIARFVIDEAHCVSHWGHDFRPDYTKLGMLRTKFPRVPVMALTATATTRVRADIVQQLSLKNCKWFMCSFNRPNLQYMVKPKSGAKTTEEIKELIKTKFPRASGIVYCLSRKECDQMAENLKSVGIKAASYHAGLADKKREEVQKNWITDKFKVVCATIAFGMGIDKPDVRYVLHFSLPKSIEGYYQESGRAGRDGLKSICILYYNYSDMMRLVKLMDLDTSISLEAKRVHTNNLRKIVNYCENVIDCRRSIQLNYFAENFTREQCLAERDTACDNCLNNDGDAKFSIKDVTDECKKVIKAVRDLCNGSTQRVTLLQMVEVLMGKTVKNVVANGYHESEYHGLLKSWTNSDAQRLLHMLVLEEYLREILIFVRDIPLAYLKIGVQVEKLMTGRARIQFPVENVKAKKGKKAEVNLKDSGPCSSTNEAIKKIQEDCYNDLLQKCHEMAQARNVTVGSVMNNQALKLMAESMPTTEDDMMKIPHVTKANYMKFGKELLEILQYHAGEKALVELDMDSLEQQIDESSSDDNNDATNWSSLAAAGTNAGGTNARKRKRGFGGNYRRKKSTARRGATPKRRRTTAKTTAKNATTVTAVRGGSKFTLLKPRVFDPSSL